MFRLSAVLLLLLPAVAAAERGPPRPYANLGALPEAGAPRTIALVGGTVLPMAPDPGTVLPDATVLLRGDRIVAVGPSHAIDVPATATVVDVSGRWVLPGLVDAHVHVFDERELPLFLAAGVTSVVNMSGSPLVLEWRRAITEGALVGPRLWTSGPMLDEHADPLFGTTEAVESEDDAARLVGEHAAAGYDLVKMHGDIEVGLYDAVVDAAHAHGKPVVGHLSERVGLLHAMKRRQATIEHTEELVYGFFNGRLERRRVPVAVEAIRKAGAAVTPTLVSIERIARMLTDDIDVLLARPTNAWMGPIARATWGRATNPYRRVHTEADAAWFRDSLAFQAELTAALDAADVPLFAGTDSGWVPFLTHGDALRDELVLLGKAGVPAARVLAAATRAPGTFYGGDAGPGVIAAGRPADLLVVEGDPLADLRNVARVDTVVARGRVYRRDALAGLVAGVQAKTASEAPIAEALGHGDAVGAVARAEALGKKLEPASARSLAMRLSQAGRVEAAHDALALGAKANPRSWSARQLAGRALVHEGRPAEALLELGEALALRPDAAAAAQLRRELAAAEAEVRGAG